MTPKPLLAVAAVLLAATATPAHATPEYNGGCNYAASPAMVRVLDTTVGSRTEYHAVVYARVAAYDTDAPATPVGATVRCYVTVNNNPAASTVPVHGTGVVVTAEPLTFTAGPGDFVSLCTEVAYDGGPTATACTAAPLYQFPPQPVGDLIQTIFETTFWSLDPLLCPIVSSLLGDDDVAVEEDLVDVYPPGIAGEYRYDCPPYES